MATVCFSHNHEHGDCPACIESQRLLVFYGEKNGILIKLGSERIQQMLTMQRIIHDQRDEIRQRDKYITELKAQNTELELRIKSLDSLL
jgi:hypothetical protein